MHTTKGLTLYELIVTLAILSFIIAIAVPAFQQLLLEIRAQTLYRNVFTLIQHTRSLATFSGQTAVLCPSNDQENCSGNWQEPLMVFIDHNDNKKRDNDEAINRFSKLLNPEEKFVWRAFGSSRYIRFISDGSTEHQSGNFSICLRKNQIIQQIKLYKTGRARKSRQDEINQTYCTR